MVGGRCDCPCARRSLGKEAWNDLMMRKRRSQNLTEQPCGSESPIRQRRPPAGSESCVVGEQSRLRSVDSERAGRVIESRKAFVVRAEALGNDRRQHRAS
jgi:hypothetical protein